MLFSVLHPVPAATPALFTVLFFGRKWWIRCPIRRRPVFIRPAHLHATSARHGGRLRGGRRHHGIRPQQVRFNLQIHLLHVWRRRIVAAIQPHPHARMAPQPVNLTAQGGLCHPESLIFPSSPILPHIATTPP